MKFFKRIVKEDEMLLAKYSKIADAVLSFEQHIKSLTDKQLKAKTQEFKDRIKKGESLSDLLPEAYAVVRESAYRVRKEFPFYVQVIGGIVLHNGDAAEMKTGEGKTLTSSMPIYLNALEGKGVVVVTTNEYLSKRDSETVGEILKFLGISVGWCSSDHDYIAKKNAYSKDVTYVTNSELGFDYLRDNMSKSQEKKVQRNYNFCIVDECDSILIDEARTPLIIAGGKRTYEYTYQQIDDFVKSLHENCYIIDAESEAINLTDSGVKEAEKHFKRKNFYSFGNDELIHMIINALKANYIFENEVQYIIKDEEIVLIDKSTGRIMHGRTYSDGLHQAIEAKEGLKPTDETTIVATITYQNLFRLFSKMSGMTGTAKTEEEEFQKIYNMRVICIPTNLPVIRVDAPDYIFLNAKAKFKALLEEIEFRHKIGQPILIGTRNVDDSIHLSNVLKQLNIKHDVLNAKNHAYEAKIIENAGQRKQVTIATNMAGRGTDIKLGKGVAEMGGLCVLATDRHESRRIDNQLRGRAGRQGDPGFSRFFLSLEDELIIRFGGDKMRKLFSSLGDTPLESRIVTRQLNQAQAKIEGTNFDSRKQLLEYDNVLSQQREVMYKQRNVILLSENPFSILKNMIEGLIYHIALQCYHESDVSSDYNYYQFLGAIEGKYIPYGYISIEELQSNADNLVVFVTERIYQTYKDKRNELEESMAVNVERQIILDCFDFFWTKHIDDMMKLRSGISYRSYGQKNPLQQYIEEASELFTKMKNNISHSITMSLNTYEINDDLKERFKPANVVDEKVKVKVG